MTLDELAARRATRKDELDLPRTMTPREVQTYIAETAELDATLRALRAAEATLVEADARLVADRAWLAFLTQARVTLCDELLSIKSPIRDRATKDRATALDFSIRLIDVGTGISTLGPIVTLGPTPIGQLMAAAAYVTDGQDLYGPRGWQGSLKETERRIAESVKRQTAAKAALDRILRADDQQAHREVLNSMEIRNSADGNGLVAFVDGEPLPVSAMTPEQQAAFEWFSRL